MKFSSIFLIILLLSCSSNYTYINKKNYTAKGFAYIYNDYDYSQKIIKGKMDNKIMQISNQNLKTGTLIKISNPKIMKVNTQKCKKN